MSTDNPANSKVLEYLRNRARPGAVMIAQPGDPKRDYLESGAHPDIVERLWKDLNQALPKDSRALAYGTPVLMNPETGEILAVAIGTSYAVRLPRAVSSNRPEGATTIIKWSGGKTMDLGDLFGADWIVGNWNASEAEWLGGQG